MRYWKVLADQHSVRLTIDCLRFVFHPCGFPDQKLQDARTLPGGAVSAEPDQASKPLYFRTFEACWEVSQSRGTLSALGNSHEHFFFHNQDAAF